jgi:L-methionine (R)-S-oxide reductase
MTLDFRQASTYESLVADLKLLLDDDRDWLVNLSNCAALLYNRLPRLNWAGFYLYREGRLILGPFQGKPACTRIDLSRGVCGRAATDRKTVVVADVHRFPGHIACDDASRSEIVVPLLLEGRLLGVLDLDSPVTDRFDATDREGLEQVASVLISSTDWTSSPR